MNRIICELGGAASEARAKSPLFSEVSFKVLEKLVPSWLENPVGVFKSTALTGDNSKCEKYKCYRKQ